MAFQHCTGCQHVATDLCSCQLSCPLQMVSANSEVPAAVATGGGGAAGVSDPPSFDRGGRWKLGSDQGDLRVRV